MRIILSRKGFDSSSGGKPSPIVGGRPMSLPIPATRNSRTTYADLGLGELVQSVTRGRYGPDSLCHADPHFQDGMCAFGQSGAAQGHLAKNGVGQGDVFLFFGLFADEETGERHHRIFGYMTVEAVLHLGEDPDPNLVPLFAPDHPHFIGARDRNNTVYIGPGATCCAAPPNLRLTRPGGPLGAWRVPVWLERLGLTYHGESWRWPEAGTLLAAARGQEFICDIGNDPIAEAWLAETVRAIEGENEHGGRGEAENGIVMALLRQPRLDDDEEQRDDPFWELGSFGVTGCHSRNLLNPRKAHELVGKRVAFAQGGPRGFKLIYLTPPVTVEYHAGNCELRWSPAEMPLAYESAPTLVDNAGYSDVPALLGELAGVARRTMVGRFASKFRSRRKPLSAKIACQLEQAIQDAIFGGAKQALRYIDCLPFPPPRVDDNRQATYQELLRRARGEPLAAQRKRCC